MINNNEYIRYGDSCLTTQMNTINTHNNLSNQMEAQTSYRKSFRGNQYRIKNKTEKQMIAELQSEFIKKRVVSNTATTNNVITNVGINNYINSLNKTKVKHEVINYNKFMPILYRNIEEDPQLYKDVCEKWGKMELMDVLGSGANAHVREAICHKTGLKYAVKVYEKYKLLQPKKKKRVYSEVELLKSLPEHSNIICMQQAFQDKRQIHVIFQYLNNSVTLHQYFRNNMLYLQERQIQKIFARIVRGICHLHQCGIAHRDIKPDNILVSFDEDGKMMVKIIDFGFATMANKADLHCGTPNFMAPELLDKTAKYCPLSVDIWALGVTLFYLFQGRYPFKGYDEKDLFRNIRLSNYQYKKIASPYIAQIIDRMLQAKPAERISARELLQYQWIFNA